MPDDLRSAAPAVRRSDRGTTLTEVLVVLALTALIASPLYLVLQNAFRNERTQTQQLDGEAQLERVAGRLEDDVRSGLPADGQIGSPADELAIQHLEEGGSERLILWTVDGSDLARREVDVGSGAVISDVVLLEDVAPVGSMFRYFRSTGLEIPPTSGAQILDCAVRVTVELRTMSGTVETSRTVDVSHRLPNPGAASC